MFVPDLLQILRSHEPSLPALTLLTGLHEDLRWTYRQLLQAADGFRRALAAGGIGPGSTVCLVAGNCPQFVALFLACLELRAAFAPLHPDHAAASFAALLQDLRPQLVIVDEDLQGRQLKAVLRHAPTVWRLRLRRTPWLRPVLCHTLPPQPALPADVFRAESAAAPALILHSSGSTGAPKVILYSRQRLNVFLHWQRYLFTAFPDAADTPGLSPRVNALPLAHFGGLSFVLQGLLDGRLVHLPRTLAPQDYLRLAVREKCQLLMLVPALFETLRDAGASPGRSALRYCLTMGEPITARQTVLIAQLLHARVYSAYGMSEGLSGLTHHGADVPADSCGRLAFGEARLLDESGEVDADEGELWVRNDTLEPCYRDPELNAEKFNEGWYRTGDRFRRDQHGHHYFLGRVDTMCVVNGRNVYPADVEQVFLGHPDVTDCMAAVITLEKDRRRPGLLVCLRQGSVATPAALIDWFLEQGALHATPAWLLVGKDLPRNAAGKRDRLAVAALLQQDYLRCARKVS